MKSVHTCPVCRGTGKYTPPQGMETTVIPVEGTCHGCGGSGWVDVEEDAFPPGKYWDGGHWVAMKRGNPGRPWRPWSICGGNIQ